MKHLLILSLAILFLSCSNIKEQNVWTKSYEVRFSKQLDRDIKPMVPDSNDRRVLIHYMIKRFKAELPHGIESVSRDSLLELSRKIGKDYAIATAGKKQIMAPQVLPWTIHFEKTIRETLASDFHNRGEELSKATCDCLIGGFKAIYPDSVIVPFPQEVINKVAKDCHDEEMKRRENSNSKSKNNRII